MSNTMNKILIAAAVRKAIKDISDSPQRSIRNIVDLACQFTKGRFQREFFNTAQTMLENPQSSYYKIIPDIIDNVDHDRILAFGMNIGYNSCTAGAKIIREIEKRDGYNIPWCISLDIDSGVYVRNKYGYYSLVNQGVKLGIFTYILYCPILIIEILDLCCKYPDCAFVILCKPEKITDDFIDEALKVKNIMLALEFSSDAKQMCQTLREKKFLYSLYCVYDDMDVPRIVDDDIIKKAELLHPLATAFITAKERCEENKSKVYNYICQTRRNQQFTTIPWDFVWDNRFVDSIISDDFCTASFDSKGNLLAGNRTEIHNFFTTELKEILKSVFPK